MAPQCVVAIVASYNVRELLLACLGSLAEARAIGELDEVVVVDNASTDGSATAVRTHFPAVTVVEVKNAGYGAAINRGMELSGSRYILALNPDTIVPPGSIRILADYLDDHPWTAIVGPRLVYPDGREQPSRRRFPTRLTPVFESTILERRWPNNPWARRFHMADELDTHAQEVDWIVGACLLIRREAIRSCGGFDQSFFMYSEETELCWRFRQHGWRVEWVPVATVIHHEGASAGQNIPLRQIRFDTSRVRLIGRMYGRRASQVLRIALLSGHFVELGIETGKWLVGHRRDLRRDRMRFYRRVLASRLQERSAP